ncbi:succinate-semialdehyde dehydrogenase, mitochondrial isoform X1 [Metopolophium dirhodum]|uniref:succinate-semialdehyde dehydrogenase, mitochondrial isoform X1 n=2 Tax=Metopolophium dirhodum TaxID=44670 RepID=UPI00298FC65B|nr:succinate-semialdehyde dehydrogenase, mitochondrial isoform X1 [Metopolophium dirhodum]
MLLRSSQGITRSIIMCAQRYSTMWPTKAYVNGEWCDAKSGKTFDVVNPATGKTIATVPDLDALDVQVAINAANDAFNTWKKTTAKERSDLLRNWYDILVKNKDYLADVVTSEAGKPLAESLGEVAYGNSFVEWFSEEARRTYGEHVPSPNKTKEILMIRQPLGPVGLITPWNFPIAMITRKAGAALAAGCTCVIKPAENTPITALVLAKFAEDAGIPKGVINIVTTSRENTPEIGKLLCESPDIYGISFTGSTEVGKLLYKQCSSTVKRVGLELGGNAPFVVFNEADIDKAVAGAMASKFRNCGQTCVSANRFIIQKNVFTEFVDKLKVEMDKLVMGDGKTCGVNLGPLINFAQADKVDRIVNDAKNKGAKIITGGKRALSVGERFYEPTLITNVTKDMACYVEEIFGPVAVCIEFDTEQEGLEIANSTNRGLAGYFYSNDLSQVWRVAKALEVGMVGVNEGIISATEAAFGGVKESGLGREGSRHGMDEYTEIKYICFGNLEY